MTPRWKIRRAWTYSPRFGGRYLWWVEDCGPGNMRAESFNVWENAILYVDIQEAS